VDAVQLPPAQIKAFALSCGRRAKTDRIDAEFIVHFVAHAAVRELLSALL
jgi:transposase